MVHVKIDDGLIEKIKRIVSKKKPERDSKVNSKIVKEGLILLIEQNQDVL